MSYLSEKPEGPGKYLHNLRIAKRKTLKEVENETGVPGSYLNLIENGKRKRLPCADRLFALAEYYGISNLDILNAWGYRNINKRY